MDDLRGRVEARMERESLSWRDAWRLETAGLTPDEVARQIDRTPDRKMIAARTRQVMSERSLDWKDAWQVAADELGARRLHRLPLTVGWSMFVFGGLLMVVPVAFSSLLWPGWGTSGDSQYANSGATVLLILLGVSGLIVFITGTVLGWKKPPHGMEYKALLAMYGGVVSGVWVGVIAIDSQSSEIGLAAAILAMFVVGPYVLLAGAGLLTGRLIGHVSRRRSEK